MRKIKIWNVYDNADPAASDNYFPTESEADAYADSLDDPHKRTIEVEPTASGICLALVWVPNR